MKTDSEITKVIFRTFKKGGEVIALFPELAGDNQLGTCSSYQHTGQHGAASTGLVSAFPCPTKPSTPDEIKPLKNELEKIGYNLKIVSKFSRSDFEARRQQLAQ